MSGSDGLYAADEINMKGLDGIEVPLYVFNRQALYGYDPPASEKRPKMICDCWPKWCCCRPTKSKDKKKSLKSLLGLHNKKKKMMSKEYTRKSSGISFDLELEKSSLISQKSFGMSPVFIASTVMEDRGLPDQGTSQTSLIKEAIHVISCGGYEEKTEWGKEIGWIYGSVTEDILTGFKMHCFQRICSHQSIR